VEVSLNIDMDTLFSDPAPLEALLQRFGRVNRGRKPKEGEPLTLADVHVFSEPTDFNKIYDAGLVTKALEELCQIDGKAIDESQVSSMLERIYSGDAGEAWQQEFDKAAQEFEHAILSQLRPFQSASLDIWKKFHELFDGVEILPIELEDEYNRLWRDETEGGYIAASSLLVPLSWGQYMGLHQAKKTCNAPSDETYPKKVDVPYNPNSGLDLETVWAEKKRQNDSEDY
jgi:CRISPR-associated endonuclease/helicase Cas3